MPNPVPEAVVLLSVVLPVVVEPVTDTVLEAVLVLSIVLLVAMEFITDTVLEAVVLFSILPMSPWSVFPAIRFCMITPLAVELVTDAVLEAVALSHTKITKNINHLEPGARAPKCG